MKKLSDYVIKRINELYNNGLTQDEIADYFNITQPSVHKYLRMKPRDKEEGKADVKGLYS